MADSPYERVNVGRLTFKGGALATSSKTIEKGKKKKKKKVSKELVEEQLQAGIVVDDQASASAATGGEVIYTIDAAKKMKYEELFPVETKKFGYDPKAKVTSVEQALDNRIKKKADRYCK